MAADITVIIPNWNGINFLKGCLSSLGSQSFKNFCVVVIDNGSSDDSATMVKTEFPHVELLPLDRNFGFAYAVNLGIRRANSEYIMLLNNDIELDADCLRYAHDHIVRETRMCGGIQCRMMNYYNKEIIDSLGVCIKNMRFYDIGHGSDYFSERYKEGKLLGLCAGAALYRRTFFENIGLLDERFFAGFEDVDISLRGVRKGWFFKYEPEAIVYHHKSPSFNKLYYFKRTELRKNYFLLAYKNFPGKYLVNLTLNLFIRFLKDIFDFINHIRKRRFQFILKMYCEMFYHIFSILKNRSNDKNEYQIIEDCFILSEKKGIW
jgi:GT2 family glycosyltransferase